MKKSSILGAALLLTATIVWGVAFVAQSSASDKIGSFTFNAARAFIAAVLLSAIATGSLTATIAPVSYTHLTLPTTERV